MARALALCHLLVGLEALLILGFELSVELLRFIREAGYSLLRRK